MHKYVAGRRSEHVNHSKGCFIHRQLPSMGGRSLVFTALFFLAKNAFALSWFHFHSCTGNSGDNPSEAIGDSVMGWHGDRFLYYNVSVTSD